MDKTFGNPSQSSLETISLVSVDREATEIKEEPVPEKKSTPNLFRLVRKTFSRSAVSTIVSPTVPDTPISVRESGYFVHSEPESSVQLPSFSPTRSRFARSIGSNVTQILEYLNSTSEVPGKEVYHGVSKEGELLFVEAPRKCVIIIEVPFEVFKRILPRIVDLSPLIKQFPLSVYEELEALEGDDYLKRLEEIGDSYSSCMVLWRMVTPTSWCALYMGSVIQWREKKFEIVCHKLYVSPLEMVEGLETEIVKIDRRARKFLNIE